MSNAQQHPHYVTDLIHIKTALPYISFYRTHDDRLLFLKQCWFSKLICMICTFRSASNRCYIGMIGRSQKTNLVTGKMRLDLRKNKKL